VSHRPIAEFEAKYEGGADPWNFRADAYERRRYDVTLASLPRARYHRAFEPGCSVGELSALLAARCDQLLATDASHHAIETACRRLARYPNIELAVAALPEEWPAGTFDLVVFSELGYYFSEDELQSLVERCHDGLEPGGHLVAVHWRGHSPDHVLHGDAVQATFRRRFGTPRVHHIEPEFVLDLWERE
jgi:SAM-dependent methyltransferase